MIILVSVPKGPGDWKSAAQSEPLPAPPVKLQPAPSRASNSSIYVPGLIGPTTTLKEPLPLTSVVTTPNSTAATVSVTPCRVMAGQLAGPPGNGNWPKVLG